MKIGATINICILSCIISVILLSHVSNAYPIFNPCLDAKLAPILRVIANALDKHEFTDSTNEIETNERVKNVMIMIKAYLMNDQIVRKNKGYSSRKFFFWPFPDSNWDSNKKLTHMYGGLSGSIFGGIGPDGFEIRGGLGGLMGGRFGRRYIC